MFTYICLGVLAVLIIITFVYAVKSGKTFRTLFLSACSGIAVLSFISILGGFIHISLPINGWTVGYAAAGGVPGVIFMLLLQVIWAL